MQEWNHRNKVSFLFLFFIYFMNDYFKIRFDLNPCTETETDVLAALLCDAGFESFEPDMSGVSAYIRKELYDVTSVNDAVAAYPFPSSIKISEELIEVENYYLALFKNGAISTYVERMTQLNVLENFYSELNKN